MSVWSDIVNSSPWTRTGTHLSQAFNLLPPDGGIIDRAHLHASCKATAKT